MLAWSVHQKDIENIHSQKTRFLTFLYSIVEPTKHKTLAQCRGNFCPPFTTLVQHYLVLHQRVVFEVHVLICVTYCTCGDVIR